MKLSARCIMNRVNLWHSIRSISSACLILMLRRTELTDGSMSTRSFSLREMTSGFSSTSRDDLPVRISNKHLGRADSSVLRFDLWLVVSLDDLRREVLQRQRRSQRGPHSGEIRAERV